jgi:hypothetical protein
MSKMLAEKMLNVSQLYKTAKNNAKIILLASILALQIKTMKMLQNSGDALLNMIV